MDLSSLPISYKTNTPKEKLVLSFCENFRRQFVHLYRDRKPLFLNPLNEAGIEVIFSHGVIPLFSSKHGHITKKH